ncbi:glucose-6-phosphate dehydrogenase [Sporolactobacillus shoreae]|uniref:Glucose-6-phosphate 1-dehydrogenase n=1 Tax=Sporolactobacillus shoreae TaxID=1465501 RepID=A0A4Z0GVB9_9BACL|nr:glucose-6-phosphate dehydrogenase [Sporolactobacillus shoreae]TGB00477.1 glucose-6-phosphate dehydrogenase [Sporolactobacillus shoreae]
MVETTKEPTLIFMFGATGDLASRKLYPALYEIYKKGNEFAVIGLARRQHTHESYRSMVDRALPQGADRRKEFLDRFYYQPLDITEPENFARLKNISDQIDTQYQLNGNRMFYLSLAPRFFGVAARNLKKAGLTETSGWKRLIIEKPFGHNLESAEKLNHDLLEVFDEAEIYRIDHYLGKEMVQNIEALRFANPIFESVWNHRSIANVQITLSETLGVGDRASYYDQTGALLDMVQNHIMQLLTLTAMEPPSRFEPEDIRQEKVKVLKSIRPMSSDAITNQIVRAQYKQGVMPDGTRIGGYHDENNIDSDSDTETFVAARLFIDNYRWTGVPFYIRTGKRLAAKSTEIVIQFKDIPNNPYLYEFNHIGPNLLVIHIQPDEGLSLKLNVKEFGEEGETVPIAMNFSNNVKRQADTHTPDAYERLLSDCLRGDSTNFTRWDEVAFSWSLTDSIVAAWKDIPLDYYEAGTMGPASSDRLLALDGFCWWPLTRME